jgi:hypothetical protein
VGITSKWHVFLGLPTRVPKLPSYEPYNFGVHNFFVSISIGKISKEKF